MKVLSFGKNATEGEEYLGGTLAAIPPYPDSLVAQIKNTRKNAILIPQTVGVFITFFE
jgi:hypothetical protein